VKRGGGKKGRRPGFPSLLPKSGRKEHEKAILLIGIQPLISPPKEGGKYFRSAQKGEKGYPILGFQGKGRQKRIPSEIIPTLCRRKPARLDHFRGRESFLSTSRKGGKEVITSGGTGKRVSGMSFSAGKRGHGGKRKGKVRQFFRLAKPRGEKG